IACQQLITSNYTNLRFFTDPTYQRPPTPVDITLVCTQGTHHERIRSDRLWRLWRREHRARGIGDGACGRHMGIRGVQEMNMRLKMIVGLSAAFLFLLMAFATHYKIRLEQLAAAIPLLSLVLASCFNRTPAQQAGKQQSTHLATRQAGRRRQESSARR